MLKIEQDLKEYLLKIAQNRCWSDNPDFNAYDFCGGNTDDAFSGGENAGEIFLAREILKVFFDEKVVIEEE